jgi:1-deoxy-D-xylulose-5-phosphate reductoisomerase
VLAQLGNPDMRTAIAHALAWPERIESGVAPLDLAALGRFDFESPDLQAFPCLGLAYAALRAGGTAPAILNAANEVAVAAFLAGDLGFLAIPELIERTLSALPAEPADDLAVLLASDQRARRMTEHHLARMRTQ